MDAKVESKPKRRKKNKSRTQVASDNESDYEVEKTASSPKPESHSVSEAPKAKPSKDAEISAAFTKFYMHRATMEFAEDLDSVRGAGDFKDEALDILVYSLQQGTTMFTDEEKRRVVGGEKRVDG